MSYMNTEVPASGPNFDLLREAFKVIEDSPEEEINLDKWVCGTQFCAGGKLTTVKKFQDLGLGLTPLCVDRRQPPDWLYLSADGNNLLGFKALSNLFGIPYPDAEFLFDSVIDNYHDEPRSVDWEKCTDRQIFLSRMRVYFTRMGHTL